MNKILLIVINSDNLVMFIFRNLKVDFKKQYHQVLKDPNSKDLRFKIIYKSGFKKIILAFKFSTKFLWVLKTATLWIYNNQLRRLPPEIVTLPKLHILANGLTL